MNGTLTLPGPETLVVLGVHIKVFTALFGLVGIGLGHLMAPVPAQPIGLKRQSSVLAAGFLISIAVTVTTGQNPLLVMAWSIGIGFAGIALFQAWGAQAGDAARAIGGVAIEELASRIARKDRP